MFCFLIMIESNPSFPSFLFCNLKWHFGLRRLPLSNKINIIYIVSIFTTIVQWQLSTELLVTVQ